MEPSSYTTTYWQYLQAVLPGGIASGTAHVEAILEQTCWDEPESAVDCNNGAVVALIEAEATTDRTLRAMYLEMAIAALESQLEQHPLCLAHLALVYCLIGEREQAIQAAFSVFLTVAQPAHSDAPAIAPGLIYLPRKWQGQDNEALPLVPLLALDNGYTQSLLLAGEVLWRSQLVFYNPSGLRLLHLAAQLFPEVAHIHLRLGISSLVNQQWEGLLYLHRAQQQAPHHPTFLHALYLAYQELNQPQTATYWLTEGQTRAATHPRSPQWQWTTRSADQPFTYVPFEQTLTLAVEANFRSIVTSVLMAEGDWFETEMEFWRDQIQPGMTVIDVGANVGVYTFSAAVRVGNEGSVFAIEPFSGCVRCLQETCRVNELDWVSVQRAAASDRNGTLRLGLHGASELNQILTATDDTPIDLANGTIEEVPCFTLDALLEQEHIQRVDLLKIDAEGHEMQVLQGSDRLLREFAPIILYENVAGSQGSNLPVADYLIARGYQLFRYQPYLKQLIPIDPTSNLHSQLNIIALPKAHPQA